MDPAIQTRHLRKVYGEKVALDDMNLTVDPGEIFGLLGVNGAGKSTAIKILTGLIRASDGEARIFGHSVETDGEEIRGMVDVSPQSTAIAPNLTVAENLRFFAGIYGVPQEEVEGRVQEIAAMFSLGQVLSARAKTLSGGWQRRVSVAVALISRPRLLFLDEPTLGLDVLARRELWEIIRRLRGKTTVVLTSHYLEEIEHLCDRVAIMSAGHVLTVGTVEEIRTRAGCETFEDAFVQIVTGSGASDTGEGEACI